MSAYKNSVFEIADHFSKAGKMVDIGSGSQRKLKYIQVCLLPYYAK